MYIYIYIYIYIYTYIYVYIYNMSVMWVHGQIRKVACKKLYSNN